EAPFIQELLDRKKGRLGVEGVEDRFDQENVNAAVEQGPGLFSVSANEFIPRRAARGGVVNVGRDGGGLGGGAEGAGDEAGAARLRGHHRIGGASRTLCSGARQFIGQRLHSIVGE